MNEPEHRRHRIRGVTSCAAPASRWRCPGWSRCRCSAQDARRQRRRPPSKPPLRFGVHLLLERRRADSLVGQGQRRGDGARPGRRAADAASARTWSSSSGLYNQTGVRLHQPAPRPHERALGRAGQPRPERHPRRHHDGPGAGAADRRPAPRCRASCSASSPTSCASKTACR